MGGKIIAMFHSLLDLLKNFYHSHEKQISDFVWDAVLENVQLARDHFNKAQKDE